MISIPNRLIQVAFMYKEVTYAETNEETLGDRAGNEAATFVCRELCSSHRVTDSPKLLQF